MENSTAMFLSRIHDPVTLLWAIYRRTVSPQWGKKQVVFCLSDSHNIPLLAAWGRIQLEWFRGCSVTSRAADAVFLCPPLVSSSVSPLPCLLVYHVWESFAELAVIPCGHYPGAFQKCSSVNMHSPCVFLFWGGVLNPVDSTDPLLTSLQLWQSSSLCFPHVRLAQGYLRDCFSTQPESPLQPVCPDFYSSRGAQVTLQAKKSHIYFSTTWRTLTATVKSKTVVWLKKS